jgi:thymidine kinase
MSRLELIIGGMFSGKSSELIRRLKRYKAIDKKVLVINSSKDTRCGDNLIQTHDKVVFDCVKTNDLSSVSFDDFDIIGIDEAQFFSGLVHFVYEALNNDKHVIVAGLDGDSSQRPFGEILNLIPLCDDVHKLKALCMECKDGTLAPFSKRIPGNSSDQELIGSNDIYKAVCRNHLFDPMDLLIEAVVNEFIQDHQDLRR